jgi:hypothetical protein
MKIDIFLENLIICFLQFCNLVNFLNVDYKLNRFIDNVSLFVLFVEGKNANDIFITENWGPPL